MAEVVTTEELSEVNLFLDAVLEAEVMKVRLLQLVACNKIHTHLHYMTPTVCLSGFLASQHNM